MKSLTEFRHNPPTERMAALELAAEMLLETADLQFMAEMLATQDACIKTIARFFPRRGTTHHQMRRGRKYYEK